MLQILQILYIFISSTEVIGQTSAAGETNLLHHWYIFEWQHRGSIHCHGLIWLKDCPFRDVEAVVKKGTPYQKQQLLEYYSKYVSSVNPSSIGLDEVARMERVDPNNPQLANPTIICPVAPVYPCRVRGSDVDNVTVEAATLINKVQRHTCNPSSCLRMNKRTAM